MSTCYEKMCNSEIHQDDIKYCSLNARPLSMAHWPRKRTSKVNIWPWPSIKSLKFKNWKLYLSIWHWPAMHTLHPIIKFFPIFTKNSLSQSLCFDRLLGHTKEKLWGVKKSYSPLNVPNHHQECKGIQRYDQHFLHMGLLSHNNKPHNIRTGIIR